MFCGSATVKQGTHCCTSMATINNFCFSESYIYASNNKMETYYFVSMATMVMQVCHNVNLYVYCLILFIFPNQHNPLTRDRVLRFILHLLHIYIQLYKTKREISL